MKRSIAFGSALLALAACEAAPTDPSKGEIKINNQSTWDIDDVYIKSCSSTSWGSDQLTISIGPKLALPFEVEPGCNDVRVVSEFSVPREYKGYSVAAGQSVTITYP